MTTVRLLVEERVVSVKEMILKTPEGNLESIVKLLDDVELCSSSSGDIIRTLEDSGFTLVKDSDRILDTSNTDPVIIDMRLYK